MLVEPFTLTCLSLATLVVAVLPILLYRRLRRPFGLDWRDTVAGIAVFALFATVIERAINAYLLGTNPDTAEWLHDPLNFVLYGTLMAGVCEECGRYLAMRMLLRRKGIAAAAAPPGSALAYGIGHGGAEAWLVGVLVQAQWIVFAVLANRGELDEHLANLPVESAMRIHLVLGTLSPAVAGIFALERISAFIFQLAFTTLMWRGLRANWRGILPVAIVVHAVSDIPAALFQAHMLSLVSVDAAYVVAAIVVAAALVQVYRRPAQPA
jgi:uncharacterized membrane protein YhfC